METTKEEEIQRILSVRKSKLKTFAETTTIHGVPDLVLTDNKITRSVWALLMLFSAIGLVYETVHTIVEYSRFPTSYKVSRLYLQQFPTITVCPPNWFDDEASKELGLDDKDSLYILSLLEGLSNFVRVREILSPEEINKSRKKLKERMRKHGISNITELLSKVSLPGEKLFKHNSMWENMTSERSLAELIKTYSRFGVCYEFISKDYSKDPEAMLVHERMGHKDIGILNTSNNERHNEILFSKVLFFIGSDRSNVLEYVAPSIGSYDINIEVEKVTMVSSSDKHCTAYKDSSWQTCERECYDNLTSCDLSCIWYNNQPMALDLDDLCDANSVHLQSRRDSNWQIECHSSLELCVKKCPQLCTQWKYKAEAENLKATIEQGIITSLFFDVAFGTRTADVIEEYYTYSFETLVSNIGGMLSLFTGASVLSLIHVGFFWCFKAHQNDRETAPFRAALTKKRSGIKSGKFQPKRRFQRILKLGRHPKSSSTATLIHFHQRQAQ